MARETCLEKIHDICEMDSQGIDKLHVNEAKELLIHLRVLSLNVVECILRWRENLLHIYK